MHGGDQDRRSAAANWAPLARFIATDEHIAELAEEVAEMYASLTDPHEYLIHDVRFHRTIARASGNPILGALMETIASNLYDNRRLTVSNSLDLKQSCDMHREIYRAIRSHNPLQARKAMEEHLNMARMSQAAESNTRQTVADTPADPIVLLPLDALLNPRINN